jgi:CarD family transcriptional regulator
VAIKKFKKGDTVIYPQHGACIVKGVKRMRAFDVVQEYLILESVMKDMSGKGMTLSVPTAKAHDLGIRPPVSASELQDLVDVLSKPDPRVPANWSRRFKNHQEKLKSGDVYQVAEVVRNLAARDRENQLSAAEKTMYDRARLNLISEIAPSKKCSTEEATRFLDQALERGVLKVTGKAAKSEAKATVAKVPASKTPAKAPAKAAAKAPAKKPAATAKAAAKKK